MQVALFRVAPLESEPSVAGVVVGAAAQYRRGVGPRDVPHSHLLTCQGRT